MSFNGSGTYIPPSGNPVTTGTVITSTWANTLVTDVGNTFNITLPRDGQAPMTGQLKLIDETSTVPGVAFNSEASSGMFRPSTGLLALTVSGVENIRFTAAGRVLIGTTTDNGSDRLQVSGTANVSGNISSSGSIGLGTSSPAAKIHVVGSSEALRLQGSSAYIAGFNTAGSTRNGYIQFNDNDLAIAAEAAAVMKFNVNGPERMRIDTSGNVGINSTTPGAKLDVNGNGRFGGSAGNGSVSFNSTSVFNVASTGVGVTNGFADSLGIAVQSATGVLSLATNSTERLRILANGNVVVGSTASQTGSKFEVNGNGGGAIAITGNSGSNVTSDLLVQRSGVLSPSAGQMPWIQFQATDSSYGTSNSTAIGSLGNQLALWRYSGSWAESARFDGAGRLLIGATSPTSYQYAGGSVSSSALQVSDSGTVNSSISLSRYSTSVGATPVIGFTRSNSSAVGTNTLVTAGQAIGAVSFTGADGSTYQEAARILGEVDSTASSSSMPGRLSFHTTASGSLVPTERMRIDSAGNVGIGTSAPDVKLRLYGSNVPNKGQLLIDAPDFAQISMYGGSTRKAAMYMDTSGTTTGDLIVANYTSAGNVVLGSGGGSERVRVDSAGNVGIGNPTPTSLLTVGGASLGRTAQVTVNNTTSQLVMGVSGGAFGGFAAGAATTVFSLDSQPFAVYSNNAQPLLLGTAAQERMRITSTGNVGVGTTNPLMPFQVNSWGGLDGNGNQLLIRNNVYYSGGTKYITSAYATEIEMNDNDGSISFSTAPSGAANAAATLTERMRLDNSGNLGVGTATPTNKLDVIGSIRSTGTLRTDQASAISTAPVFGTAGVVLTSPGGAGNFSPAVTFDVGGGGGRAAIYTTRSGAAGGRLILATETAGSVMTEAIRIDESQSVGIGTTSPSAKLHVNGAANINGSAFGSTYSVANAGTVTNYKIATLPISTSSTFDSLFIEATLNDNWTSGNNRRVRIMMSNRGGFVGRLHSWEGGGQVSSPKIAAYTEADGSVSVWLMFSASVYASAVISTHTQSGGITPAVVYANATGTTSAPTGTLAFDSGTATPWLATDSSSNFGVGTSAPGAKLHVAKTDTTPSSARFTNSANTAGFDTGINSSGDAFIWNNANTGLAFGTNNVERMRITAGGALGLGTNSPGAKLHINLDGEALRMQGDNTYLTGYNTANTTRSGYLQISTTATTLASDLANPLIFTTNGAERFRMTPNGELLVNSTSSTWTTAGRGVVEVNGTTSALVGLKTGNTQAGYTYHDGSVLSIMNTRAGSLILGTNNASRLTIDSTGNVSIAGSAVMTLGNFTGGNANFSSNGYQKLPSGLILQWYTINSTIGGGFAGTYNFPIAFPSACFGISHNQYTYGGGNAWVLRGRALSTTQFQLSEDNWNATGAGGSASVLVWALGY